MGKKIGSLALFILVAGGLLWPEQADFETAEKFAPEKLRKMIGDHEVRPNWIHESNQFWYKYRTTRGTFYYIVDADKRTKKYLFKNGNLAGKLTKLTHRGFDENRLDLEKIEFNKNNRQFTFKVDKTNFIFDLSNRQLKKLDATKSEKKDETWQKLSPDKKWILYAKNHNLFLMKKDGKDQKEIQLTQDGIKHFSYAASSDRDRPDEKVRPAARWFKNSKKIYVKRADYRKVKDLWLVHSLGKPRPTLETYKYPMAGEQNLPQHELKVFDVHTRKEVLIDTGKWKDQAIGSYGSGGIYTLEKGDDRIYFTRRDRTWRKIELCVSDTRTGKTKVLLSENSIPYFHYFFAQFYPLNEGREFIWWSERDGWGHFYLYDQNGKLKNRITRGSYHANRILKIDEKNRLLYLRCYGREKTGIHITKYFTGLISMGPICGCSHRRMPLIPSP